MATQPSPFLRLPTELRLLIYSYALLESPAITVGTAELVGHHSDIVHRLYGDRRKPIAGTPANHEPVVDPAYNPDLLSITNPATIELPPGGDCPPERIFRGIPRTHTSLLLVDKRINAELATHFASQHTKRSSLFVSFPHGLHVLTTQTPGLLRQARSVHIAGIYKPRNFDASHGVRLPLSHHRHHHHPAIPDTYIGNVTPNTTQHLEHLISSVFGREPRHPHVEKLEMRIYYPGTDSYTTVWGDDDSPTSVALRSIAFSEIELEVWRGQGGTGVYLSTTRREARGKRSVSTVWRRLEEGRRGQPACGSWVVDPEWPVWREGEEQARRGEVVVEQMGGGV